MAENSSAHPEILGRDDFDDLLKSSALFARKFDSRVDDEILDMIDETVHSIITEKSCLKINKWTRKF